MSSSADFFVDGGTLRPQAPSYVTRPADHELLQRILDSEFCYVLTARQMGKSSLMVRTARSLQERGVKTAIVDLTIIGTVPIDRWYLGLLKSITSNLRSRGDVSGWWREHQDLGAPQRFFEFLHDVLLQEIAGPVAIFIDEIDTTLNLDFRDDFFAGIRAMYNARASDPTFKRLTFVLLGVATPTDLIKDQKRTPFNIGTRIELQDFSYDDGTPLRRGLDAAHPGQGDRILRRIFYWTNGHPYLTQRLCLLAAQTPTQNWDNAKVDQLVHANFLAEGARSDPNLIFVQDRIQAAPDLDRRRMLELYGAVRSGIAVANDDRSPVQNYLELFGLVRVEKGRLQVRNRIYWTVFDEQWVQSLLPPSETLPTEKERPPTPVVQRQSWRRILAVAATLVILLGGIAFALGGFGPSQGNRQATETAVAVVAISHTAEAQAAISPSPVSPSPASPTDTPTLVPLTATQTPVPPTDTATPVPPTNTSTPAPQCQTNNLGLVMHSGPSNGASTIGGVPAKTTFTPLARDRTGFWLLVEVSNQRGWISASAEFVACNFNIQTLPVAPGL